MPENEVTDPAEPDDAEGQPDAEDEKSDLTPWKFVEMNRVSRDDESIGDLEDFPTTPVTREEKELLLGMAREETLRQLIKEESKRQVNRAILNILMLVMVATFLLLAMGVISVRAALVIIGATGFQILVTRLIPRDRP